MILPTRIFLDLDDVCNQLSIHALQHVGCEIRNEADYDPRWGYDLIQAANESHPTRSFTTKSFWESIGREVWATAPESREFRSLLDRCGELVGRENVCLLSSPTLDPDCLAGKLEWIQTYMPKDMQRQFLIGPRKHFCARPDALLIDDSDRNVRIFREHFGQAILVPRPWNSMHKVSTWAFLGRVLTSYYHMKERMA